VFFFDIFFGGIVSSFFGGNTVGANVGGCEKSEGIPEHGSTSIQVTRTFKSKMQFTKEETKNLLKTALASKVVNPFTRALAPPFIERRRDFLHPENNLKSREYS
jgi:hypothetical protein